MKGKHVIITFLVLYLLLGGITVCVYANDLGYFDKKESTVASVESAGVTVAETVSPPEVVPAATVTETIAETAAPEPAVTESSAPETAEIVAEEGYPEDDGKAEDPAADEAGGDAQAGDTEAGGADAEVTTESQPVEERTAESTAEESTAEESATEESAATEVSAGEYVFGTGKYYKYTVTDIPFEDLAIHPDVDGHNGQIGYRKPGDTGYVIGRGQWRTLIMYEGQFGYISNKYSILTEVSAAEYPDELKNYSWNGDTAAARKMQGAIPEYVNTDTEDKKNQY